MTLANDFYTETASTDINADVVGTIDFAVRVAQLVIGVGLTFVAVLIWIAPGSNWSMDLLVMKSGFSIVSFVAGAIVLNLGRTQSVTEVEIDAPNNQLRVVEVAGNGDRKLQSTIRFEDLHKVDQVEGTLRFWQDADTVVAEVATYRSQIFTNLKNALRRAGKLD